MRKPVNVASPEFLTRLDAIEPGVHGTPCSVVLFDGRAFESSLAWEHARFSDMGSWISPEQIAYVAESTKRMPAEHALTLSRAGESGMGYHLYVVELADGAEFVHVTGNYGIDLVNLPDGYTSSDIMGVRPHEGRDRTTHVDGYRQLENWTSVEYMRPSFGN